MPQLPFAFLHIMDSICCGLAIISEDFQTTQQVLEKDIENVDTVQYEDVARTVFDFMDDIKRCIRNNAPFDTIPRCTPEAFYPEHIKRQRKGIMTVTPLVPKTLPSSESQVAAATPPAISVTPAPRANHGYQGGRGGRGAGRGGGRGGGGRGRGDRASRSPADIGKSRGCIHIKPGATFEWPEGMSKEYCKDWMCVGRYCTAPYGECESIHTYFNRMNTNDKKLVAQKAKKTGDFWFDAKTVSADKLADEHKDLLGTEEGKGKTY